jgi:glycerophosphoryl diester phosphodiesterase
MRAFALALDEGADGVELDVRLDADGDIVVLHDPTLERVTHGRDPRAVAALTRRDLDSIDVGGGQCVPRLLEVLAWARERDACVNVELKHDAVSRRRLVRAIGRLLHGGRADLPPVLLSSFDPFIVLALGRLVPSVWTGWLVHDRQRIAKHAPAARALGARAVHPQRTLVTPRAMAGWKARKLPVHVWTVNDVDEARHLAALGVDAIITDTPRAIVQALKAEE